ncbi:MAG: glucoamylase family protein, partial [Roseiarcus sp.]
GFAGYGENCWGISASNGPGPATHMIKGTERRFLGYMARGVPDGPDDGTIAPSAVAASFPFAPEIVAPALRYFATLRLRENGAYGLEAAFNATIADLASSPRLWVSPVHVGISRGPIVLMIENYRTGLIWGLMRGCPYVVAGLRRVGFSGGWLETQADD